MAGFPLKKRQHQQQKNKLRHGQMAQATREKKEENQHEAEAAHPAPAETIDRFFQVIFFDSFAAAKSSAEDIRQQCSGCDQLNVVIRAEGNMDDEEILGLDPKVRVYAGAAWTLIHERRQSDGWYQSPHQVTRQASPADSPADTAP